MAKYRRKPIERDVIEAIKAATHYHYADSEGTMHQVSHEEFERDYEPMQRGPRKAPKKQAKTKLKDSIGVKDLGG